MREKTIKQIDVCDGEEVIDHETEFCIQEEQYEEQVRIWLRQERATQVLKLAENFTLFPFSDQYRSPSASSYGGWQLTDAEVTARLRSSGTALIGTAARQAWAGNLRISKLPFPIHGSHGKTEL